MVVFAQHAGVVPQRGPRNRTDVPQAARRTVGLPHPSGFREEASVFEIVTTEGTTETVSDADSYVLEGPLTTFFAGDGRHATLSAFSVRVASFRTDRIVSVRRCESRVALRAVEAV